MKRYTAAVIGCGRIGFSWDLDPGRVKPAAHLGALSKNSRIKLVGAADTNRHQRYLVSKAFPRLPVFSSAEELFKKTHPDIVVIATPDDSHYPIVKIAAGHKTPLILCEKPIAANLSDAKKTIQVAKKHSSILLINHMRRFDPILEKLGRDFRDKKFGTIQLVRALYVNGLLNNGTHTIDLLRWYLGDIKWVSAWKNKQAAFTHEDDYNADAILHFKNGTRGIMQSLDARNYYLFEQQFYGTKKTVMLKNLGLGIGIVPAKKSSPKNILPHLDYPRTKYLGDEQRSFFKSMADYMVGYLDGKEKLLSTGEDGYKALEVLIAIRKSVEQGGAQVWI